MSDPAAHADKGQWESIRVYDLFHTVPVPTEEATYDAWALRAAFAASTSRVRLGQMCTCMSYRHPANPAKVASTVDIISGGRTEMGIGGGWSEHEWKTYGYGCARGRALPNGWRDREAAPRAPGWYSALGGRGRTGVARG